MNCDTFGQMSCFFKLFCASLRIGFLNPYSFTMPVATATKDEWNSGRKDSKGLSRNWFYCQTFANHKTFLGLGRSDGLTASERFFLE